MRARSYSRGVMGIKSLPTKWRSGAALGFKGEGASGSNMVMTKVDSSSHRSPRPPIAYIGGMAVSRRSENR